MSSVETITIESDSQCFLDDIFDRLLQKFNLKFSSKIDLSKSSKNSEEIVKSIFNLTTEARLKSAAVFKNIHQIINVKSRDERERAFFSVIDGIFDESVTFGKIIVVFGFIIELLMIIEEKNDQYSIIFDQYYNMGKIVIYKYIHPWVKQNGGWTNFVNLNTAKEDAETSETIAKVGKVVLVAAGLWALSKLWTN